ncbi:DUF397 domain-containing protein [Kitasatospora sp. NPDC058965]|uniref:DUF397 domain-containing protein n=1 Tax=Kitasatospora sp. NPDC058965 TaxID=3346682 RepID=UPI0036B30F82
MPHTDLSGSQWVKSSYSDNGGNCIEIAPDFANAVPVRDSKDPEGPALVFPTDSWGHFLAGVRAGAFHSS